ncbi:hypothetical protein T12_4136 [Trichinella patagoniensis]|uniref:Uncharacterized protein n=1 Tax=Trichinella patagoniensis TaxID=990121 RepID=A0A0V0ZSQ4_9BILA|nr:hypothetical protein T12_4136 [Trichinella patagoniensis]
MILFSTACLGHAVEEEEACFGNSNEQKKSTNSQSLEEPYGVLFVRWKMNTLKLSSVISQTFVGHFSWFQADVVGKCRKFLKIMHVRLSKASGAILVRQFLLNTLQKS